MSLLAAIAGPIIGGLFQNKANRDAQRAYGSRIRTTVKDARKAGINPLEAIRAGAGNALPPSGGRLVSDAAISNSFDAIADVLSGRTAAENKQADVQAEIQRIDADTQRRGTIPSIGAGAGIGNGVAGPSAPALVSPSAREFVETNFMRLNPSDTAPGVRNNTPEYYEDDFHVTPPGEQLPTQDPATRTATGHTSWRAFGIDMIPNPWFSDGEAGEARGGEVTSNLLGVANTVADPLYTAMVHINEDATELPEPIDGYEPPIIRYTSPFGGVSNTRPVMNPSVQHSFVRNQPSMEYRPRLLGPATQAYINQMNGN
jgi:type II secretory pathway pseudopilin PulG